MENANHCPVCNKAGIPDYHIAEVVCPQCASDLKPYFLLNGLKQRKAAPDEGSKGFSPVLAGISGLIAGALLLGFIMHKNTSQEATLAQRDKPAVAMDSSVEYRQRIALLEQKLNSPPAAAKAKAWHYTVKTGDNLWSIASRFYGDGNEHVRIRTDNGLADNYVLQPGQVLSINPLQ